MTSKEELTKEIFESDANNNEENKLCGFKWMRSNPCLRTLLPKTRIRQLFVLTFSMLAIIQGMSFTYFSATLTTMEKRLKISSKTATIVMSGNEVSQILLSIPLSYLGGGSHRPRWMSVGVFLSAISCFVLASPHLLYGPGEEALSLTYEYQDRFEPHPLSPPPTLSNSYNNNTNTSRKNGMRVAELCDGEIEKLEMNCDHAESSLAPLILIFLSQFVAGIGSILFFTLGGPYMDDNMKQTQMPFIMGLTMSFRLIGPVIGYLFAAACLKVFISPSLTPLIDSEDSRWLGAWWLGWIVMGSLTMLLSFLTGLFPKDLPNDSNKLKDRANSVENKKHNLNQDEKPKPINHINGYRKVSEMNNKNIIQKYLSKSLKSLVANRVNLFNNLAGIFYLFGALGFGFFMPKYIETVYRMNPAEASSISGTTGIAFQAIGLIASGALISKYQPNARKLAGFNVLTGLIFLGTLVTFTQLKCHQGHLDIRPGVPSWSLNLTQDCNAGCHCNSEIFDPVCSLEQDIVFYSPCHAGCQDFDDDGTTLSNCSCVHSNKTVVRGTCTDKAKCSNMFYGMIGLAAFVRLFDSFGRVGNILIGYRCVDPSHKSLAIGLSVFAISLLSSLPSPILFGAIIDSVCLVWGSRCGERGNCLLYDSQQFVYAFNITALVFFSIAVVFDTFVYYYVKDLDLYDESNNFPSRDKASDAADSQTKT